MGPFKVFGVSLIISFEALGSDGWLLLVAAQQLTRRPLPELYTVHRAPRCRAPQSSIVSAGHSPFLAVHCHEFLRLSGSTGRCRRQSEGENPRKQWVGR